MDKYILSKNRAVGLGTYLVSKGYIEKEVAVNNAKRGLVPSGFELKDGAPRISWVESPMLAQSILTELDKPEEEKSKLPFMNKKKKN